MTFVFKCTKCSTIIHISLPIGNSPEAPKECPNPDCDSDTMTRVYMPLNKIFRTGFLYGGNLT